MIPVFLDPSAASLRIAIKQAASAAGIIVSFKDTDNDVTNGIACQSRLLKQGIYAVSRKCQRTIKDYFGYCWDTKAQLRGEDSPMKTGGFDHTKDAERYPLQTLFGNPDRVDLSILRGIR
jgi:hypothetical protein